MATGGRDPRTSNRHWNAFSAIMAEAVHHALLEDLAS
jgi:hypothetical protein